MDRKKIEYCWPHYARERGIIPEDNQSRDPELPLDYWFQYPHEGKLLFVVFYTRRCRWRKCLGCNLPRFSHRGQVDFKSLMRQMDFIFNRVLNSRQKLELKKIILSNNGSVLDIETFPRLALIYFISRMKEHCPNVSLLTIETRIEYARVPELQYIAAALKEGEQPTEIEFAVGVEVYDEETRNKVYKKGLTDKSLEQFAAEISRFGFRLKTYFMLKPVPGMSEEEAVADIVGAIGYLDSLSRRLELKINLHLNVTFVADKTVLAKAFNESRYTPPRLDSVLRAVMAAENTGISVYVGLDDEGLSMKSRELIREGDQELIKIICRFNKSQNYNQLKKWLKKKKRRKTDDKDAASYTKL